MTESGTSSSKTHRLRGRGALSNRVGRFEPYEREAVDDGWPREDADVPLLRTEVAIERPRRILSRNSSPDIPFDRSINPYRGCEHACVYCFARPSHAFLGLSPGLDFEARIVAKPEAPEYLARELGAKRYVLAPIAIGTNTDPYQPVEARFRIMRSMLEVLRDWRHPVTIVTKGSLIERDIDILAPMAREGLVHVGISLTTLDKALSRRMEPRAPSPERRLAIIQHLTDARVPVRVMVAPIIPGLTDHEMETLLAAAREAGAETASWILLRLPGEVGPIFREWLDGFGEARARKVLARLREMHGGREYDSDWGKRMRGQGVHADLIRSRFRIATRRLGYAEDAPPLRTDLFRRPERDERQLALL
ncbi:PA0069 family radical SAM protein [Rhodobacteraceae bacterium DSL-40]|uniref:PA0069 family radical SAM protein n=1 Tax=Amaricoccus sp. B4 TaxID=3368557 RepID=UPI000DAC9D9A